MLKRFFMGLAVLSLGAVAFCSLPAASQVSSVYATGTISGASQSVTLDLGGQSTCNISLTSSVFVGTIVVQTLPVGGSTWGGQIFYDQNGLSYSAVSTFIAAQTFTAYPASAGSIRVFAQSYTSGSLAASITCSPASGQPAPRDSTYGAQYAIFPSAQPVTVASAVTVNTPAPVTQVTAVPSCPPASYPCGLPTPQPLATDVSGNQKVAVQNTPGVTVQNAPTVQPSCSAAAYPCGFPTPVPNSAFVSGTASGLGGIATVTIAGASTCRYSLAGTWVATVKAKEEASGSSTFNQVPSWDDTNVEYTSGVTATGDYLFYPQSAGVVEISVTSYTSGTVTLSGLNCSPSAALHPNTDSSGNESVAFPSAQPVNIMSPAPGTTPIPYQSYAGNVLKIVAGDTGGTAWTPASPEPVETPAPMPTAPSPAPVGVMPIGYNAAGAAAPVICTNSLAGAITTSAAQLVGLVSGKSIYVCAIQMTIYGTVAGVAKLEYGTGTACATGTTVLASYDYVGSATVPTVITIGTGFGQVLGTIPAGNELCTVGTGTISAAHISIMYERF